MFQWIFGVHPVIETLRAHPETVREVLLARAGGERGNEIGRLCRELDITLRPVHRRDIDLLAKGVAHQGVAAEVTMEVAGEPFPAPKDPAELLERARDTEQDPLIVALDRIQDPRNLGALVRSAHALGAHGVITPRDRSSDLTSVAMKASAGAAAHIPVCRVTNLARALDDFKKAGLWVVGADAGELPGKEDLGGVEARRLGGSKKASSRGIETGFRRGKEGPLFIDRVDLTGPLVLVIGAEGPGLRRLVKERCDRVVQIPMTGRVASLNASVAGGILLYEVLRQRRLQSNP